VQTLLASRLVGAGPDSPLLSDLSRILKGPHPRSWRRTRRPRTAHSRV